MDDMDTEIIRKVFGWKGLNTLCYITEGGKATLDLRRSFFLKPNYYCAIHAGIFFFFCVNIDLAQYASVHKRTLEIKNSGVLFFFFFSSAQYITSALKPPRTQFICMETYLFTKHIHAHTCTPILNKSPVQKAKPADE